MADARPLDAYYLYVLKDATGVFYVTGEPTLGDIERIKAGGLEIIRLSDLRHLGADGVWHPPKVGGLTSMYSMPGPPLNLPLDSLKRPRRQP
jgi:hypothetical protein